MTEEQRDLIFKVLFNWGWDVHKEALGIKPACDVYTIINKIEEILATHK